MQPLKIKKRRYSFEDRNAFFFCYLIVGIPLVFFIFFWVYVNASSVFLAFKDNQDGSFTLNNFKDIFTEFGKSIDRYNVNLPRTLGRTVLLWFLVNVVCVVPSMLSTYVLNKKIWGASIFRVILMVPSILGGMIWVMVMKEMVGTEGPIIQILQKLGVYVPQADVGGFLGDKSSAFITIIILNMFPHIISLNLIIAGSYARIPEDLYEVGRLEGVNFIKEFFIIAVPLVWPTIVVSMITNFATMFTFEGNVFLYTGGTTETSTMGYYIYQMTLGLTKGAEHKYGYPAAFGVLLTAITIPVVLFGKLFLEKLIKPVEY